MTRKLCCVGDRLHVFMLLAVISISLTTTTTRAVNLVQEFYLPMPEQQIYQANSAIIAGTSSTSFSTFSIVVTGDGTTIYYDQWEDGYEPNLGSPVQSTTQVWGDGNDANGIPPGFAHDPLGLPSGTVITLTNNVALPRNPSTLLWDARDRVAANKALVISRAAWPVTPGPVFAGAVGVLSTMDYGTTYISPVGQNLPNNLFKYVGMFIMAAQNNTVVTIDPTGTGLAITNIVLNQGESYLVNGGILVGGRVAATKAIQADLIIGHVGASYASDWFTLYPVSAWDNTYYTPVSSAASGSQPAYVYLFNPNTNAITINYNTRAGGGSFSVPATGTNGFFKFQTPIGSGASFTSAGGQNFFAVCTVAANNTADTSFNWGFTLVPKAALTTEATVGWGPGSADGTVDGSPVWVTTLTGTKVYVDYKGDRVGPLTDPNGNKYDTNFTVTALQSLKIYDPSKNQAGMRVYTVDGTLLTAAWGEDPDVAQPGNPYIDAGTTVIPFPVPVLHKTVAIYTDVNTPGLSIGDTLKYTVQIDNRGLLPLGNTVVIDAPSTNLTYVTNSTTFNSNSIPDSLSGTAFPLDSPGYTIPIILSQGSSTFTYLYTVNAAGVISNSVNIGGTAITTSTSLSPAPTNGASVSLNFTLVNGVSAASYLIGANVFVTMTNAVGNSSSNSIQTIAVTVTDTNSGDAETISLVETSTNSGVFRNTTGLPTSAISGLVSQDGTLYVAAGDTLLVSYTDPVYFDSASATAAIQIPVPNKQLYLSTVNGTSGNQFLNRVNPVATPGHGTTYSSIDIGSGSTGNGTAIPIGIDGAFVTNVTGSTLTFNYTVGGGTNRLMLVSVGVEHDSGGAPTISAPTVNGASMDLVNSALKSGSNPKYGMYLYAMTNPPSGSDTIAVSTGTSSSVIIGVDTFTNVSQTTPLGSTNTTAPGTSIVLNSATNQLVYGVTYLNGSLALAGGQSAVNQWTNQLNSPSAGVFTGVGSTVTGSNTTTTAIFWNTAGYAVGVSIVPSNPGGVVAVPGPATNTTSFVQTPTFGLPFTMPSGGAVTITNFITVTNGLGSFSANPNITATLRTNGVNFLTLTNPLFTAAAGVTNLVWTSTLNNSVTISFGTAITYVVTNNVANTAFHVNYDSTNNASLITLPASTVIAVTSLGVYDAPYPGGNLVTTPIAGSTLYVRATVTDPFGAYDISRLNLGFTAPSPANNFTVTNVSNIVTNDTASRTYEYQWVTSPDTGGYTIVATATEGTEGVNATATAGITTIFLDLGTPSTTEFTAGANGVATNSYTAGNIVSVRVTDLNRNTNSASLETITATITNSVGGDFETITLVETGVNTGIFTNSINVSTNVVGTINNGTLYAPVGSILTANYSDPTDPTDNTSATATVLPAPGVPGIVINKTILSPTGGQTGVGQPVTYNLQVVNVGSTTLPSVSLVDTFTSARLSFTSASVTPNSTTPNSLTWNNLGTFAPGQSTNITVSFTTLATGTATNSATANGVTATNTSSVTLSINAAALNVTKIVLSPTNQPVAVGSNVVFRITIQNVGNTLINNLPFEDNFSGAYYQFVSSTIQTNGSGFGTLIWTNLASPITLATNAIITNDVTMKVIGQGNPANNTAIADFATDVFGNMVPVASSTIGVVTSAGAINGSVYDDKDQSGTLTTNDVGLANVTLALYTDPNGDGNPADGALVQTTTTDSSGYYEFLNLTLGHYVIVENLLPGYAGVNPANNQLAINLNSLVASTNNNYFNYQPSATLYSTMTGTVYNDVNGGGTNYTGQTGLAYVSIDLIQDVNSNGIVESGEPVVSSTLTDTNGNYTFAGVTPGYYVIRETDLYGYYSSGDSQPPNNNQISFNTTNGIVSTNNSFFDRLLPVAVNDTNSAFYLVPVIISPLPNDISPNGDALTITGATATSGVVVINPGNTNLTFTPTNGGVGFINYSIADAHGGSSNAVITVNVTTLADLTLGKSAAASVTATSNLVYTITVTNLGPSSADNVTVTDALPAGVTFVNASGGGVNNSGSVTWSLGTLSSNQVSSVTLTVTAPANGSLTNVASVGSPTSDPNPTNNVTPPVTTTVTSVADIAIGKAGPATILASSNFSYTISVTNFGPSIASGVIVTDALPVGATFVSATGGGTNNNGVVTWNLSALASNQVSSVTVTVTAPASGSLTNVAVAGSPASDPNPTNNVTPPVTTSVTPVAEVSLVKTAPALVLPGNNFAYTITVTNNGPSDADSLSVTDNLPANVTLVSGTPGYTTVGSQIIWTNLGTLTANTATSLSLTVTAPVKGGITNTASAGSPTLDPTPTNNVTPPVTTTVSNLPPVAVDDAASTPVNLPVTIYPLGNDSDPNGDALVIVAANPTNGTASFTGTNILFTPALNFLGTATVGYTISDGNGGTSSAIIFISVTNRPPVANDDVASGTNGVAEIINPLVNDTDPDGDALTITAATSTNGIVTINGGNTSLTFTPTNNGTCTIHYTISDGRGGSASAVITVGVGGVADLALGKSAAASVTATSNLVYTITVTNLGPSSASSVTVTDALPAGVTFVSTTSGGVNNSGTVTWNLGTLTSSQVASVTVTVTVPADGSLTNSASVGSPTSDPNPTNNVTPPVTTTVTSVADIAIGKAGPATILASSNFSYTISVTNFGPSLASSVTVTDTLPAGVTFVSADSSGSNVSGVVTWNLGTLSSNQVTNVTVTVTSPASGSLTNFASAGSPTSDPNPTNNVTPPVTTGVTPVADVSLVKTAPAVVLPGANFDYTITVTNGGPSDADSLSVTDNLPANVTLVSATPGYTTAGSTIIWTNLGTLAANTATSLSLTVTAPVKGGITNTASAGSPTLDPTPTNNVTPPVTSTVSNLPPVAVDDAASTPVNLPVTIYPLGNDTDPNGDMLTITGVSPTNGVASFTSTNILFTPAADFLGTATVGYTISDGNGGASSAIIFISVTNRPPVANDDAVLGTNGVAQTINPLGNDSDPDGDALTITAATSTNGIVTINGGNTSLTFTPTNDGTCTINYTINDGRGGSASAVISVGVGSSADLAIVKLAPASILANSNFSYTISVTNLGPSDAVGVVVTDALPVGVTFVSADSSGTTNGGVVTWNLGTMTVLQATNLTLTVTAPVTGMTLTNVAGVMSPTGDPNPTNNVTPPVTTDVSPSADVSITKSGPAGVQFGATYAYTLTVSNGGPSTATSLSVTDTLPAGVVFVSSVPSTTTNASSQVIWNLGNVAANVTSNLTLTVKAVTRTTATNIATGGSPTFDPNPANNTSAPVFTSITNRPPLAVNDSGSTAKNVAVTIPVLVNDSDPDGDALTIISVSPTNGTANIVGMNVVFTPTGGFTGTATVGYSITDGFGGTNSALITITVTNHVPVANGQSVATTFNTAKAITLTGSDADGDALTFIIVGTPSGGTLSLLDTNTGAVTYTPTNNFSGVDSFTFRVNDGTADSATATVTVTVSAPTVADLAVFKTGPASAVAGSNLVYTITVTNIGPDIATNVLVSDHLPAGYIFVTANPMISLANSNTVIWAPFNLAPHTKTNYTITAKSLEGGTYTNIATATSFALDPNPTNNDGTLTNSQVRTVVFALADVAVFKDGGTNTPAGGTVTYTITATNSGPSTATNVVVKDILPAGTTFQNASGSPTLSNNVVIWPAMVLTNGASVNFTLALTAPGSGSFTNIALGTSDTGDPNPTNNNGTLSQSRVATKVVASADLIVLLNGPTNAVQGSNFVYSIIVSNAGPSVASNAIASDLLPTNLVFVSATGGGTVSNGLVTWPKVAALASGGKTNYSITVYSPLVGVFTNSASGVSTTFDPNPTNNTGVLPASQVRTTVSIAQFNWIIGTPVLNPQTGLYEETVIITNTGSGTVAGFQVYVTILTPNVYLWNATGTNGAGPYVQYNSPVDPSNHVSMILEFYDPLRVPFTNTLRVVPIIPAASGNVGTNGSVAISNEFTDTRSGTTRFVIEFASVPGKTYTIIYSPDMVNWKVATPSVTASANVTQWYDDGPPKTESVPASIPSRFYRVIKN